jgi:hypothetical protein
MSGWVPRNVVTVSARAFRLPTRRNRDTEDKVEQALVERFRARAERSPVLHIKIDFPKRESHRAAKERVAAELDRIDARWRRVFKLYPTEAALRQHGE